MTGTTGDQNVDTGTMLTCTNPDCDCQIQIVRPCPHGEAYTCACGHAFVWDADR